jgi:aryl-alcohol dehydrogenase-like predicted oxidoreductase
MRRVTLGTTGIETSCLGFGCASLGSRVGAAPGLRALAAAFDAGVTWLDLAPLYGGGRAEEIAGRFLKGRRDRVQVCSKVGLAPGGGEGLGGSLKAALMPAARAAVKAVPALRPLLRRSGVQAAKALPLTRELVTGALETSLRRLGTDHLDLYALHGVAPEALTEPVLRALEDARAAGKARAAAVAGDEAAGLAAIAIGAPFGVVQAALPPPGAAPGAAPSAAGALLPAARAAGFGAIVHSVFGVEGSLAALKARMAADEGLRAAVTGGEDPDPDRALARRLLERAFALNPDGVVLVSMFSAASRAQNLAVAAAPPPADAGLLDRH